MEKGLIIASPGDNAVGSFVNDSIASMNDSFYLPRITQNDESILSPKSPSPQSPGPYSTADFGINASAANEIYKRVLKDLQPTFSRGAVDFFQQFEHRLESIVDLKFNCSTYLETLQQQHGTALSAATSASQTSALEARLNKFDEDYENFMDKYDKFNKRNDKRETTHESLTSQIESVKADITVLDRELKDLRQNTDEQLAKSIQDCQAPLVANACPPTPLEPRVRCLETLSEQYSALLDEIDQYNRQYILEFLNIVNRGRRAYPERTTDVILQFLWKFLGMRISCRDISICHRQDNPSLRKKMGRNYIMPIYCKFLNRSVVHEILRRRHLLKNARNELNNPYIIRENLTFNRRLLWDSVQENLGHFRYKWVKRGKIYVRQHANSEVIKVLSERVLNDLTAKKSLPGASLSGRQESTQTSLPQRTRRSPDLSNKGKYANRYASIVNSSNFPRRSDIHRQTSLPFQPYRSEPIFSFRNTSFVNYRSPAF